MPWGEIIAALFVAPIIIFLWTGAIYFIKELFFDNY